MSRIISDTDTILAIDLGFCTTRVTLFDLVDGGYRFIALGTSPSTCSAPLSDSRIGVIQAIEQLQEKIGYKLLNSDKTIISPSGDGIGIDSLVMVFSAGPALKTVLVGLSKDDSLNSVRKLASTTYSIIVDSLCVEDERKPDEWINTFTKALPDIILMAGGTDEGASRPLQGLADLVGLACYLIPEDKRPSILYAGNTAIQAELKESLEPLVHTFRKSSNIRPFGQLEDLQPAVRDLSDLVTHINRTRLPGFEDLYAWSGGNTFPSSYAQGRMVRFLSKGFESQKGVLAIDLGSSALSISAGFNGHLIQGVYPHFGLGTALGKLLNYSSLDDITRWLPGVFPDDYVKDYLNQKANYPHSLPATMEDMALEQAVTRQVIRQAIELVRKQIPSKIQRPLPSALPELEPILVSGSAFINAPTFGQTLLILLDSLEPIGTTTIILDKYFLLPVLGAIAEVNPLVLVQVMESGIFEGLASVVVPVSDTRPGTKILSGSLISDDGNELTFEIDQGTLDAIPLPVGMSGKLLLEPHRQADVGFGPGRKGVVQVSGTHMGVVFDARGRPLRLPKNPSQRQEIMNRWLWILGG